MSEIELESAQSFDTVMPGLKIRKNNKNGFTVISLHYTADPVKANPEWIAREKIGVTSSDWEREYEINYEQLEGKPAIPGYNPQIHRRELIINPHKPVYRGWDFGFRKPACVWFQIDDTDRICILKEKLGSFIKLEDFISDCKREFPDRIEEKDEYGRTTGRQFKLQFRDFCDPAGVQKNEHSGKSSIQIMRSCGVYPQYKKSSPAFRLSIMRTLLEIRSDGEPGMLINQSCVLLHQGLIGGYTMPEEAPSKSQTERDNPTKDGFYEHIFDALGYALFHIVTYRSARNESQRDVRKKIKYDPITGTRVSC